MREAAEAEKLHDKESKVKKVETEVGHGGPSICASVGPKCPERDFRQATFSKESVHRLCGDIKQFQEAQEMGWQGAAQHLTLSWLASFALVNRTGKHS